MWFNNEIYNGFKVKIKIKFNINLVKIIKIALIIFFIVFPNISIAKNNKDVFYFEVQYGNITIAQINLSVIEKNNVISFRVVSVSEGISNIFYKFKSELFSRSIKKNIEWIPDLYSTESFFKNKKKISIVRWINEEKKLKFKNDPPLNLKKVYPIPSETIKDVIDPLTALLQIMKKLKNNKTCEKKVRIFDGRRRYDFITKDLGIINLKNDRPKSYKGKTMICGIKFYPIGGHRLKSKWKPKQDKFSDIKIYFGKQKHYFFFPVRMSLNRWFGEIIVRLVKQGS